MLNTCCCGLFSVRSASYCVAFYTCIYFLVMLTISVLGLITVEHEMIARPDLPPVDTMTIGLLAMMATLFTLGIISAGMLLMGLCKGRAWLLVPIICTLTATIVADLVAVISISVQDLLTRHLVDGTAATLLLLDLMTMAINLWCIVCVVSQYRIYRGSNGQLTELGSSLRSSPLQMNGISTQKGVGEGCVNPVNV
ncbi:uncharacterized protein LOC122368091 [Amphibalanus amphitrite]|uniref:uncharacterized protein LOC122368091 n=1 Tax=Amphibalanus amphitrite TaxID=1232801 RepID=UPI001C91B589|nr:uncharacterized protein LOC122368091 [Amphibalanus amphitrite]